MPDSLLDGIADAFNPLLTIAALAAPFLRRPRSLRAAIVYYLSAGLAIGFVYLVRAFDHRAGTWASAGLDYSTHSAYAASLSASIAAFQRRWLVPLALLIALYFGLQLFMRYHSVMDILTSASLAAAVALLLVFAARRAIDTNSLHG
jgi:hypothetical protein